MPRAPSLPRVRVAVVGAGIVGLATARHLLRRGLGPVAVLDASRQVAAHQSARNSGVVHAGLYYAPGSLKARLCTEGHAAALAYARARGLRVLRCGKLVVALDARERGALQRLFANARRNGVADLAWLDSPHAVRECAPDVAGVAAVHSPHTAVVSWAEFARAYAADVRADGGVVYVGARVDGLRSAATHVELSVQSSGPGDNDSNNDGDVAATPAATAAAAAAAAATPATPEQFLPTGQHTLVADRVITCAGMESDRLSRALGGAAEPAIVPILGDYLEVVNPAIVARLRTNVYPVPPVPHAAGARDEEDGTRKTESPPFLGVHYTPSPDGRLFVGPSAVPAAGRYAYALAQASASDVLDTLSRPGVWRFAMRHPRFVADEMYRALVRSAAVARARRYVPALAMSDFVRAPVAKRGLRAHAVSRDGRLVDDFVFETVANGRVLNVRNAPSPGATAALAIARVIVERSEESLA